MEVQEVLVITIKTVVLVAVQDQEPMKVGAWVVVAATQEVLRTVPIVIHGSGKTVVQVAVARMISMELRMMQR